MAQSFLTRCPLSLCLQFLLSYLTWVPSPVLPVLFSQTHPPAALRYHMKHHESRVPSVQEPGTSAPSLWVPLVQLLLSSGSHSCHFVPVLCLGALIKRQGSELFGSCGIGQVQHKQHYEKISRSSALARVALMLSCAITHALLERL